MGTVGSSSQSSVAPASGPGVLNTACPLASAACSTSAAVSGLTPSVLTCFDVDFAELMPFKQRYLKLKRVNADTLQKVALKQENKTLITSCLLHSAIKCLSQQHGLLLQLTRISSESLYSKMRASHSCFADNCVRPHRRTPRYSARSRPAQRTMNLATSRLST